MEINIILDRYDRCFIPGENVEGVIQIECTNGPVSHNGIKLVVDGAVNLQLAARSGGMGLWNSGSSKPMQMLGYNIDIAKPGKVSPPRGKKTIEYPFAFKLKPKKGSSLYETYHGVYINVTY